MEWTVIAALGLLGVAIIVGLVIAVVTSVSKYAKQLTEPPKDRRRGFEVKPATPTATTTPTTPTTTTNTAGSVPGVQREKDDHHG